MRINNLLQNKFMDETTKILTRALDFRSANQQVISENLANVDTPGFNPKELRFDQELQKAFDKTDFHLNTTHSEHFSDVNDIDNNQFPVETVDSSDSESGQLNIDAEMAKMMRNNLLYEATAKLISKKLIALRNAIEGLRR